MGEGILLYGRVTFTDSFSDLRFVNFAIREQPRALPDRRFIAINLPGYNDVG